MTKRIPIILLLMAVLTAAVPYAHAQNYTTWQKGVCTTQQQSNGWCFPATNFLIQIEPDVNGNWPITSGTTKQYQYLITPTCTGSVSTLQNLVMVLPDCNGGTVASYLSSPSGAAATTPAATTCPVDLNNTELWIANKSPNLANLKLNCGLPAKPVSIYTSLETAPSLTTMGLVSNNGCQIFTTPMLGPGCLGNSSGTFSSTATGQGSIEVQSNSTSSGATGSISAYDPTTGTWTQSSVSYPQMWLCQSTSPLNSDGSGNINLINCPQVLSFGGNFTIYADSATCEVIDGGTGGAGSVTCIPSVDTTKAATYGCNSTCACLSPTGTAAEKAFYTGAKCK
jgi:hypothetical protein